MAKQTNKQRKIVDRTAWRERSELINRIQKHWFAIPQMFGAVGRQESEDHIHAGRTRYVNLDQMFTLRIESPEDLTIRDLVVLLLCVALAQNDDPWVSVTTRGTISLAKVLRHIGPLPGWLNDEVIGRSLALLGDSELHVMEQGKTTKMSFLLYEFERDTSEGFEYSMCTSIEALFSEVIKGVDFIRVAHLADPLAMWLHVAEFGYQMPNDLPLPTLLRVTGYDALHSETHFRDRINEAISELQTPKQITRNGKLILEIPAQVAVDMVVQNDTLHIAYEQVNLGSGTPGSVFAITTASAISDGFIDFTTRLGKDGHTVKAVVRMAPARKNEDNSELLQRAIFELMAIHKPQRNDIVAIVRGGGGDRWQYHMYQSQQSIRALNVLRNDGVHVVMGVGHTKDHWAIDAHVDHVAEVPYAAAVHVCERLAAQNLAATAPPSVLVEVEDLFEVEEEDLFEVA